MSDEKKQPKPLDDLKEGLGLLFRAAKGAVETLPTDKVEEVAKDAVKEIGRAFETVGNELDKAFKSATGSAPPPGQAGQAGQPGAPPASPDPNAPAAEAKKDEPPAAPQQPFDDAYAPEPPKPGGPRVG